MLKKIASVLLFMSLVVVSPLQVNTASAATAKIGGTCKVVGAKKTIAGKPAKCLKKGKKKIWVRVAAPAPTLGSAAKPAPLGTAIKIGNFQVALRSVTDQVDSFICSQNMFNSGCTIDGNFDGVPDPAADKRWIQLDLTATNNGAQVEEFRASDVGSVQNGTVVWTGWMQPVVNNSITDLSVLPGGTSSGALFVQVSKGVSISTFVLKVGYAANNLFFFNQ